MRIAVARERIEGERRVAISPEAAKALVAAGHDLIIEAGAGLAAGMHDAQYESVGASIAPDRADAIGSGGIIVGVHGPTDADALTGITADHVVIGLIDPVWNPGAATALAATGATAFSLDLVPRSTRAQSMDVLSSTATVAGTQAVLTAAYRLSKLMPLMITAAGTIPPARLVVLGAGVAGLQAIATARRLGAVVEGYDIREEALEQIRSVGAKSIEIPPAEDGADSTAHDQAKLTPHLAEADIVITAAQIPGRKSPILVTKEMVEAMKPGAMVIDLAAIRGGNCELTRADEEVVHNGVTVLGPTDLASGSAFSASRMFANNVVKLIELVVTEDGTINLDTDDEIIAAMLVATGGEVVHPQVIEAGGMQ